MKVVMLHRSDPDTDLRLCYAQTRGTTTSKGFDEVYANPARFFPKAVRELEPDSVEEPADWSRWKREEMVRLVDDAIQAGHLSVTRGVHFTFTYSVSRSTGRQMLRHKIAVEWEEMSQRYVKLLTRKWYNEARQLYIDSGISTESPQDRHLMVELFEPSFEIPAHILDPKQANDIFWSWFYTRLTEVDAYLSEIEAGVPAEDARENLPNAMRTEMIATYSFEALKHFLAKRLCTRAQAPIREAAKQMRKQVIAVHPWMAKHLMVQCLPSCICPESRPDGCPLLSENGGNVLRKEEALAVVKAAVKAKKVK